jgi:hypothetical protein
MGLVFDMDWCFDRDSQELDVYQVSFIDLHYMNMNFLRLVVPLQWRGAIRHSGSSPVAVAGRDSTFRK